MKLLSTARLLKASAIVPLFAAAGFAGAQGFPEAVAQARGYDVSFVVNGLTHNDTDAAHQLVSDKIIKSGFNNVNLASNGADNFSFFSLTGTMNESNAITTTWNQGANTIHSEADSSVTAMNLAIGTGVLVTGNISVFAAVDSTGGIPAFDAGITSSDLKITVLGQEFDIPANEALNTTVFDSLDAQGKNGLKVTYGDSQNVSNSFGSGGYAIGLRLSFNNFDDNGTFITGSAFLGKAEADTSTGAVPEPASLTALAIGGFGLLARRRRQKI
jgi:hypothetical protein